jgi:hypothetical protein
MLAATVSDSNTCMIDEKDTLDGRPEGVYFNRCWMNEAFIGLWYLVPIYG